MFDRLVQLSKDHEGSFWRAVELWKVRGSVVIKAYSSPPCYQGFPDTKALFHPLLCILSIAFFGLKTVENRFTFVKRSDICQQISVKEITKC
jgi:hypothetical protein